MNKLFELFSQAGIVVSPHEKLENFTTFKLGGQCRALIHCQTPEQLELVITQLIAQNERYLLIGGGSNLVVSDHGVDCYIVRYFSNNPIVVREGHDLIVSGSTIWDDAVRLAIDEGLEGINYGSGIPGTVGGAVVGNAGAFGKQIGDVIKSVELITSSGIKKQIDNKSLQFTYRHSILKETEDIVLSVRLSLKPGSKIELQKEREEILKIRHEKHPDLSTHPCAGSFFRNIEPTSKAEKRQATGWFLEQSGGKELRVGGALIFSKHANIIVKGKDCQAQDVYELQKRMSELVKHKFNLELQREVRFVGKFEGMPMDIKSLIW